MRITDNTITNIAPASNFLNPAVGVLVIGPIVNIEIADNLIRRQISPTEKDNSPWQAVRIVGVSLKDTIGHGFGAFDNLSAIGQMNTINSFAAAAAPNREQAGIHGNSLHGYGKSSVAEVFVTGPCRFSDNDCSVLESN